MEALITGPLAAALEAGRPRFNALFAQARHASPALDAGAFAAHLREVVAPVVERVAGAAAGRAGAVAEALYELSLDLLAAELFARCAVLCEGWRRLLPRLAALLASCPRQIAGAVSNALWNLSRMPGARPGQWLEEVDRLAPRCGDPATLLRVGQVLAWRAGMAHFREGALSICAALEPALARAALGLGEGGPDLGTVLGRLREDPWLRPAAVTDREGPRRELGLVAEVGGFRGFGGPFVRPPVVAAVGGQILASDGEGTWVLCADVFGATLHRTDVALPAGGRDGAPSPIDRRGTVTFAGHTRTFGELRDSTSSAADATTLAVTVARSHKVYLVALAERSAR
jgi:hypothetical protein